MDELSGLDPSDIPRRDRRGTASSGPDDRWQETTGSGDRWTDPDDSSDRWTDPTADSNRDESFADENREEPLADEDREESRANETFDDQPDGTDLRDITDPSGDRSDDTLDRPGGAGAGGLPDEVTRGDENRSVVGPADSYGFEPQLPEERTPGIRVGETELSTRVLLLNVVASQLLFAGLLVGAVWWTGVPSSALGLTPVGGLSALAVGTALGLGLWLASETGSRIGRQFGLDPSETLRDALAPSNRNEWILLLGVVLPVVALFEEFLFRSVLIGAVGAGFDLPAWALVVGSSVVFALAHSAQGYGGIVVTGLLGAVLGTAFVATGSFLVVVLAHYLVNALEFVVHESNLLRTIARWRVRRRLGE
jgi:membrane protease YdiL (CAAX protease family)